MNTIEPKLLTELINADYDSLMGFRVRRILMICSNYDAFILEEDGQIESQIYREYIDLNISGGGVIFYGSKDTMIVGCYGSQPYLLSGRKPDAPKVLRRVELSHVQDWVRACKEDPSVRVPSASDFSEAGPFNEMVVMGVLAVRLQDLNMELEWDGEKMEFTNIPEDATIKTVIHDGFTIKDGHPTFNKTYTEPVNAREFAKELIRHTYQNGYKLPDMPEE